jgi:hypothetical protein
MDDCSILYFEFWTQLREDNPGNFKFFNYKKKQYNFIKKIIIL